MRTLTRSGLVTLLLVGSAQAALGSPEPPRRRTLGKPFGRHLDEPPRHLAFSPDGTRLVSAGAEFLCVHDARSLVRVDSQRHPRREHQAFYSCRVAAFDPGGRLIVEAGGVGRLVEPSRPGESSSVVPSEGDGAGVGALSPDGAWIALASAKGGVIVEDVRGARRLTLMTPSEDAEPTGLAWSSDGLTVAAILILGDLDGEVGALQTRVRAWDARTGAARFDVAHTGFAPFNLTTIVGIAGGFAWTQDHGLITVDSLGRACGRWTPPGQARAYVVAASADGALLAVALDDGTTHVLERDLTERARLEGPHGVTALAFDRAGRRVAVAEYMNLRVFDLADPDDRRAGPHHAWIDRLAFSPDGRRLASLDGGGSMGLWDLATGVMSAKVVTRAVGSGGLGQLGFSPAGELLGTNAHGDSRARLDRWTADGAQLPALMVPLPEGYDQHVGLAPASGRFAAGSTVLSLFDATGAMLGGAPLPAGSGVGVVALSRDGALAAVGGRAVLLLDLLGGRPLRELAVAPAFVGSVAITPDGGRVAARLYESPPSPGRVVLWDVTSGARVAEVLDATSVTSSPDGARVAVGLREAHEVWLLDAATGKVQQRLLDLPGALSPLTFSADGAWLAWGHAGAVELVELGPR